ncbi:MAG: hypothetical protein WB819_05075 [Terriglobia bacterium]
MSRKAWMIFLSVQAAGIIFWAVSYYALGPSPLLSGIGVGLMVSGNLLLLPGSMVEVIVVHKLLSQSGFSMGLLVLVGMVVAVVTNLAVWLLWAKLFRSA